MRAVTFQGKESVRVETVADPKLEKPTDAIVAVRAAGLCGSDLHVYHERERGLDTGTVMGHEFVGEIIETGSAVTSLHRGDRVVSPFTTSCGSCSFCRDGLTARCVAGQLFGWVERGAGLQGAQAEYVRVPLAASTLVRLPEAIGNEAGVLLGDVLPTGWFCAEMAAAHAGGLWVVIGCGPVGLCAVLAARAQGAGKLLAVDPVPERLALAERFGAEPIDPTRVDVRAAVRDLSDGRGADAVLELVGSADAGRLAYDLVRPGGTISVVGVHNEDRFAFSPAEAYDKNLTYRTGRCPARAKIDALLPQALRWSEQIEAILSHRVPLEEAPAAYDAFARRAGNCTKFLFVP